MTVAGYGGRPRDLRHDDDAHVVAGASALHRARCGTAGRGGPPEDTRVRGHGEQSLPRPFTSNHTDTILDDDNNDRLGETRETVKTANIQLDWPGVTMSSTGAITFLPEGTVVAPATITLRKAGTGGKTITITQAGSIQVQ
jgi:hypothetical protein